MTRSLAIVRNVSCSARRTINIAAGCSAEHGKEASATLRLADLVDWDMAGAGTAPSCVLTTRLLVELNLGVSHEDHLMGMAFDKGGLVHK
jgi:hypothetical protein